MSLFLAQADWSNVPAEILKWVLIILGGLVLLAGVVVGIIVAFRKSKMEIHPQPLEVRKSPKRYNHDATEIRFVDHERRIAHLELISAGMEARILSAGEERETHLRDEIQTVRKDIDQSVLNVHERVNAVLTGVSRLEGAFEQWTKK